MGKELIYPKLSYEIVGILYDVFNKVGAGHKERYYQNALLIAFKNNNLDYKEQVPVALRYDNQKIGQYYLDFLIEDKIILEIKSDNIFRKPNIEQIYSYLKSTGLKLGIIANFTRDGVKFKRIVNIE